MCVFFFTDTVRNKVLNYRRIELSAGTVWWNPLFPDTFHTIIIRFDTRDTLDLAFCVHSIFKKKKALELSSLLLVLMCQ